MTDIIVKRTSLYTRAAKVAPEGNEQYWDENTKNTGANSVLFRMFVVEVPKGNVTREIYFCATCSIEHGELMVDGITVNVPFTCIIKSMQCKLHESLNHIFPNGWININLDAQYDVDKGDTFTLNLNNGILAS